MPNYSKIWEMMSNYTFEIDPQIFIHMKCLICNKLLNDAWDGPCGCNYCKNCVQNYLQNGDEFCPGDSKECRLVKLSIDNNIVKSNSTDRKISKLQVKCPSKSCIYTSDMADMSDHIATCDTLESSCPFSELGCFVKSARKTELENHLSKDLLLHNKLSISWLTSMKHEIISTVSHQISSNADLERLIDRKLADKWGNYVRENHHKQMEIEGLAQQLRDLTKRYDELAEAFKEAKEIKQIENKTPKAKKRRRIAGLPLESTKATKCPPISAWQPPELADRQHQWTPVASHVWDIASKLLRNGGPDSAPISSTHFDSVDHQYQMALDLIPCDLSDGSATNGNTITVRFYIKSTPVVAASEQRRPVPMEVTIAMRNKTNPAACRIASRQCDIAGSPLLRYFWIVQPFSFKYADLVRDRVAVARTAVSIECSVGIDLQV